MPGHGHWSRDGLLLSPPQGLPWAHTHAALPAVDLDNGWLYFSPRDTNGRAHIARAAVDLGHRTAANTESPPVLTPGPRGTFDDAGVTMSCLAKNNDEIILYYTGWTLGRTVPFYLNVGSATSRDGGTTFRRDSAAPLFDRSDIDPYLTASPFVMLDEGRWRMWYVSGTGWRDDDEPCYHIKYAESEDGRNWERTGVVCIDYRDEAEHAISRPWVVRDDDRYRMWFASRGTTYRIAYAESDDGLTWRRVDEPGALDVEPEGWESEMLAYPCVIDHDGERLLLYNGNGYGRTGIGIAVRDEP